MLRYGLAVLFGLVILAIGLVTVRGFSGPRGGASDKPEPAPLPAGVRLLFWCENCGAEFLVMRRGADTIPRHCGEPMHRREEVVGQG
jgi:hypothetical protein